jgi:preprotein translocase subunit YajC
MKRTLAVFALMLALSAIAFAHGNEKHVMGTVTSISDSSITVETTAKNSVTVEVSDKTKFEKSGVAATLKDLKVGDKVVIHAGASGGKLVANEVHFGAMKGKQSM